MIHFVVAVAVALLADMCLAAVGDCLTAGCASDSDVCTSDVCVGGPISLSLSLTSAPLTAAQIEQVETFYRALPDNGVECARSCGKKMFFFLIRFFDDTIYSL